MATKHLWSWPSAWAVIGALATAGCAAGVDPAGTDGPGTGTASGRLRIRGQHIAN